MPARRTPTRPGDPARRSVRFFVDGRPVTGLEGESVAASLLAAGRSTLSRSFRFHRGRGPMCDTGRCGWCACRIDGRPSVHACRVPVREGLRVESEHAWPSVSRDVLSLLGIGARFVAPTFYHHRFLRPRRLRRTYLDVLRALGGRGRLTIGADRAAVMDERQARRLERIEVDVLVIGGGEGGLLAAAGAASAGARVTVLDEGPLDGAGDVGLAEARSAALAAGVTLRPATTAIGWYGDRLTALDAQVQLEITSSITIAATGTIEEVPRVPGADRPGVMAARLVERLLAADVLPGERVLLLGDDGTADLIPPALVERLLAAGATVVGPVPTRSLVRVHGRGRVSGVTLRDEDGHARRESVDIVAFAARRPSLDLPLAAGAALAWSAGALVPSLDESGRTSVPHLFVAGGAAGRPIRDAAARAVAHAIGSEAGRAALETAREPLMQGPAAGLGRATLDARPGDPPRPAAGAVPRAASDDALGPAPHPRTIVCFCEDVHVGEIDHECRTGYGDPELVKRRTGALTGPCQGTYCRSAVGCVIARATGTSDGAPASMPTARPPFRATRLADLATDEVPVP